MLMGRGLDMMNVEISLLVYHLMGSTEKLAKVWMS
jgi:hypothetical protein